MENIEKKSGLKTICMADVPEHVPAVRFEVDADYITLFPSGRWGYPEGYSVTKHGLHTAEDVLGWVVHLSTKRWVDTEALARFAVEGFSHIGVDLGYKAWCK